MSIVSKIRSIFTGKKVQTRGYREVASVGGVNDDWNLTQMQEDQDVQLNIFALRSRSRDLWKTNPYFHAYRDELCANVFGANGITLRMKVKEEADRVIYAPDEKTALRLHEKRINRVLSSVRKRGIDVPEYRIFDTDARGNATVRIGEPDVYANKVIEEAWAEWKRAEFCDARGARNYTTQCQLRLIAAATDGDVFIRKVMSPAVNKFGFALQIIPSDYCDHMFNVVLSNKNVVRMGIEYQWHPWGLGKAIAYYFLKPRPNNWQMQYGGWGYGSQNPADYERIPAEEIIHYGRVTVAGNTRPAPWCAAVIPNSRHLTEYERYEVIAARSEACKNGFLYSDIVPEGGMPFSDLPNPQDVNIRQEPGGIMGLPYGVKYQSNDPKHPNGNYPDFRTSALRAVCAGLPGACYSVLGQDYGEINFSAGRLERLSITEMWKVLQSFDITSAETPIFESFLEMALITGAVPLPLAKYRKFNKPFFQGRRWQGIDPLKEAKAAAESVANLFTSKQRVCAEDGQDFEDILFEQAEERAMCEQYGIPYLPEAAEAQEPQAEEEEEMPEKSGLLNGRKTALAIRP